MKHHPLDKLINPSSVALVGASDKLGSNGNALMTMSNIDGFSGRIYPVNPRLSEIKGIPCYPDISSLPETPEHVAICVASDRVESVLDQVISKGSKSITIFASCNLPEGDSPPLRERIRQKSNEAGIAICGANCMGFYNTKIGLRIASFNSPPGIRKGGIAWISQSGSTFGALAHNDRRLGFVVCVSTGMELVTGVADYMDWAMDQRETRVIGLFLETIRDPDQFIAALERARSLEIPVVALKVGCTEKSAKMALTHTGAIAGNDAAFQALFCKFGVLRVHDMDEMAATLALLDTDRKFGSGKLATIHDSGGEREQVVDLAENLNVEFAELTDATRNQLSKLLEPGLEAENPLDAYGTHTNLTSRFAEMIKTMMDDPNVGMGFFMSNPRDNYDYAKMYTEAIRKSAGETDKLFALVTNYSMTDERKLAQSLLKIDVPLIKGTRNALLAARNLLNYGQLKPVESPTAPIGQEIVNKWKARIQHGGGISVYDGLQMLSEFGLNTPEFQMVTSLSDLERFVEQIGLPVVLKTAENLAHKSDAGGVDLNIQTNERAKEIYLQFAEKFGERVLVMKSVQSCAELGLGAFWDEGFGMVVVISAGGILIEYLQDKAVALAPFDAKEACKLIGELKASQLLEGIRGRPAVNLDELAHQVSNFSIMVDALSDSIDQIDVNPIMCSELGSFAVDCHVVPNS